MTEGLPYFTSHGAMMSFEGAKMSCKKACHIGEADRNHTLPNGKHQPHHGHRTVPGLCPLISTLNDVHGRSNESGKHVPVEFFESAEGWIEAVYDEQFVLKDEDGHVLNDVPYSIKFPSGSIVHGTTDAEGRTERHVSDGAMLLELHLGHI